MWHTGSWLTWVLLYWCYPAVITGEGKGDNDGFYDTATPTEKQLIKHLLMRYERHGLSGRPVVHYADNITVYFRLSLIQVLDVDEKNQVLKTNIWYHYVWTDSLLRWTPAKYGNITNVRIPSKQIWIPDIMLYNFADDRLDEHRDALVVVDYTGDLLWMPQAIINSSCALDTLYFPFDEQVCSLKFGSWTYHGGKLNIDFIDGMNKMDVSEYIKSNEWDVIENTGVRNVKYYTCCPEPYPDLTFSLRLRRKVAFYAFILILPCGLLSLLTMVIFWVPPESPAKLQIGMNIFLAFFVLLLLLTDYTPRASASIPLIGSYFCLSMILITMSTVLACIVANMYFRGVRINRAPRWLRSCIIDGIARFLGMRENVIETTTNCATPKKTWSSYVTSEFDKSDSEMVYARVHLLDMGVDSKSEFGTDDSSCGPSPAKFPTAPDPLLEDISSIREYMDRIRDDEILQEERKRNVREWRIIASVVDRIFFVGYVFINVLGVTLIFTKGQTL
ncbi:neuronal acetylcholine receptor subunit alpha-2-like [Gigantopelta aegis]|uniref:neuronal acetylcholine receptor subunit alpha-2-like n=1 Tax=Gigantopelta aegis TaxID=1735272 RepID=UPI001B889B22|nr:neuronal acetylcholine receptor subunit alpha-2-like [Gigantopelta aegis]